MLIITLTFHSLSRSSLVPLIGMLLPRDRTCVRQSAWCAGGARKTSWQLIQHACADGGTHSMARCGACRLGCRPTEV